MKIKIVLMLIFFKTTDDVIVFLFFSELEREGAESRVVRSKTRERAFVGESGVMVESLISGGFRPFHVENQVIVTVTRNTSDSLNREKRAMSSNHALP